MMFNRDMKSLIILLLLVGFTLSLIIFCNSIQINIEDFQLIDFLNKNSEIISINIIKFFWKEIYNLSWKNS